MGSRKVNPFTRHRRAATSKAVKMQSCERGDHADCPGFLRIQEIDLERDAVTYSEVHWCVCPCHTQPSLLDDTPTRGTPR